MFTDRISADHVFTARPLEDYALLSNLRSAVLVSKDGSIDWYCPLRFDAPACFAALLGTEEHGFWRLAPADEHSRCERRYLEETLVLETVHRTADGAVRVTDCMPVDGQATIIRHIEGLQGKVLMRMRCRPRFHYGRDAVRPEVHDGRLAFYTDDLVVALRADQGELVIDGQDVIMDKLLHAGDACTVVMACARSADGLPHTLEPVQAIERCAAWWRNWVGQSQYQGPWRAEVQRSLIILKALIYEPAGGMVAAPTTSLPEVPGGIANWDYRFCWLRDAAFALKVLINAGFDDEARAWRDWLQEAVSAHEGHLHALYTIDSRIAPKEIQLDWLPGYLNSRPVRAYNAASTQYQLDIRGELMELLHLARRNGLSWKDEMWTLQCRMLDELEERWCEPDTGIWEFRTLCSQLTHSKIMCWVAFDRSIEDAEQFGLKAPLARWRRIRDAIREDVMKHGVDPVGGHFVQRYGSSEVDASLLMIPLVGFVPADDPRMKATVAEIERTLCRDGLVYRYCTGDQANEEGAFLACCFWLVDNYWLAGRHDEAQALFRRLVALANDVGLLAEEYNPSRRQLQGNFPQGLSHLALISTAWLLSRDRPDEVTLT